MTKRGKLRFSVSDKADGHDVTPETVPLGLLKEFVEDVAKFIRGDDKEIDAKGLLVSVKEGSLELQSYDDLPEGLNIWDDIEQLANRTFIGVDSVRAKVADKWRADAVRRPTRRFFIGDSTNRSVVTIDANSFFSVDAESNWVEVERYLEGVVEDWGGLTAPNIHLRFEDGKSLKIDATREQIREQERNPVYHAVVMRVLLEEDLVTGEKRSARFISFADYDPQIDEQEYEGAIAAGQVAWADVEDAAEWVRAIRGGKE